MSVEPPFEQFNTRRSAARRWLSAEPTPREGLWLGIVLALIASLPVLLVTYPQMVDYPAHMARYHVMLSRDSSPFLQKYYGFEWRWMGNLGADMLIRPLSAIFPLETAGRIIAGIIPPLLGLGIVAVEWALRRRVGVGSMLAFAFIWSPAMLLGFLNFGISLALALFSFALWVRMEGSRWRPWLFMPISAVVYLCHVSGWGVLGILVFGYEWQRRKGIEAFFKPMPLAVPMIGLLAFGGSKQLMSYGSHWDVYKWAVWKQAMRGSIQWLDYASLWFIAAVLIGSLAFRRFDGRAGWAAVIMLILSIVMPRHIFGGDLVDARMIYSGLLVGCLALSWRAPRWVVLLAPLLFLGRLGVTSDEWVRESAHTAEILKALDYLPQGAKVASVVVTERRTWGYNTQEHVGAWAVVRKDALNNSNFALPKVHMMTILEGGSRFRDPYHRLLHRRGAAINLTEFPAAKETDWFLYVGNQEPEALPAGYVEKVRGEGWILARLAKRPDDS
ncbi:hypothetical protein [Novosphingobium sp.]|uniref:hypothetical protein n=1 Tax=Novosphingobium sp. TaxID=1874826 RepID=UPI0035AFC56D